MRVRGINSRAAAPRSPPCSRTQAQPALDSSEVESSTAGSPAFFRILIFRSAFSRGLAGTSQHHAALKVASDSSSGRSPLLEPFHQLFEVAHGRLKVRVERLLRLLGWRLPGTVDSAARRVSLCRRPATAPQTGDMRRSRQGHRQSRDASQPRVASRAAFEYHCPWEAICQIHSSPLLPAGAWLPSLRSRRRAVRGVFRR